MRLMQRFCGPIVGLLVASICLLVIGERAEGQQGAPSAEQLQMFQGLSPEQQQAVLGQLSGNGGESNAASGFGGLSQEEQGRTRLPGGLEQQSELLNQQNLMEREKIRKALREGEEGPEPLIPVLRREDWVVIEIDYQLPPRPTPPYMQQLYAAQAAQGTLASGALSAALQNTSAGSAQAAAAQIAAQTAVQNSGPGSMQGAGMPAAPAGVVGALSALAANGQPISNANGSPVTPFESQLSDDDRARFDALMMLVRSKNPYRLSRNGELSLPGFPPIAMLGLTEEQATLRLKVEPAFRGIDIRLTRLPIKKTGSEGLQPFGYDLFDHEMSTFAPATNVPVPSEYVVGAGDELDVQLYGNQNRYLKLMVSRDGHVNLPDIGPVNVGGQTFEQVKEGVEARIARQMIGVRANVTMGDTRSIRVFVLGEVSFPGSYTISGLGTITSALYAAGGARRQGSLRNLQLKRHGALVRQLDLYDLLIRGDTSDDTRLLQGDVIFIPPVGPTVSIDGEVRRPAIYEVKGETTVADLLQLAGGLTPEADQSNAMLTRIDATRHRIVIPVDLSAGAHSEPVRNGDLLQVARLRPTLDAGIVVQGYLYSPGSYAYRAGIRLSDVIRSVDELRPDADIHYLLIRRETLPDRHVSVLSADLAAALKSPGSTADVELQPRDRITVFDLASGRDHTIQPLLDELRVQGTSGEPTATVHVDGQVKVAGEYPLETGMRVSDLIRAGGGAADAAFGEAELTRYSVDAGGVRNTELMEIDLAAAMRGDPAANVRLQAFDTLNVKEVPLWEAQETIAIKGEVRFPGSYPIRRGETLRSVIGRAGGLTKFAFPEGSVFTREWLRKREQEQLNMLATRMETEITAFALGAAAAGQAGGANALSVAQSLLGQVRGARAVGRMVIDLPQLMREREGSPDDVILRGGDQLVVPRFQQQVTVLGEVQNSTSLLYNPRLSRDDYIAQSGGMTRRADRGAIYVVRANGSVLAASGSGWFRRTKDVGMKPGDTIVVPLDVERMPLLPFWQAITGILYNVAIAVAAVHAL
jgi:polysaccharide biosynthesis/export protein